ncbi:HEXXH motif domain-containing protein [Frankia sp. AiPa1]|uniref:HEXXH motif domain-containing protein n=1 Tax=Frankia sp. AiPa1 TaxID=573492 RepID=UPI00202B5668|nr:HEXXH motif domain-containing protein [Frankia sp. AiPa1]MCL9760902.1 HEXXH motif domain-containing protein [Frankia sp. AiPa1]
MTPGSLGRLQLVPHRLTARDFDAIASGRGDAAVLGRLRAAEHSRRLLLLRALLDTVRGHPQAHGPLPSADHAWDLLERAEHRDAAQVAAVLDHPATGLWAVSTLRRLRGRRHDDSPLWVEVGHLHAIAAAAAIRAGISFRSRLPVRRGSVVLPTLGHARLPGLAPWESADLVVGDGPPLVVSPRGEEIRCADDSPDGSWLSLSAITLECDGVRLQALIDDVDPYRHVLHSALPVPLPSAALERWRAVFHGAWQILARDHVEEAIEVGELLRSVVPSAAAPRHRLRSASSGDAFGAVLLSVPENEVQLAATLVHEMQHAKLGALLHLTDLYTPGGDAHFYAPWRDDPRTLGALLQGIYAFAGVTRFWCRRRAVSVGPDALAANFEFARWREAVRHAMETAAGCSELGTLGHRFLLGLSMVVSGWLAEPVPRPALRLAGAVHADHRAGWRLHHLRPSDRAVADLVEAWSGGRAAPVDALRTEPEVAADPTVAGLEARGTLVRHWLYDGKPPQAWAAGSAELDRQVRGALPADLAWLAGDTSAALAGFQSVLDRSPYDPHAWSGLGLAARDASDDQAALALLDRPELVRALHRALRPAGQAHPPDRMELARWIGQGLRA